MECLAKCVGARDCWVPFAVACAILCASSLSFSAANRYSWMLDMTACRGRELYAFTKKGGSSICSGHGSYTVEFCLMPSAPIDNVRADFPMGLSCGVSSRLRVLQKPRVCTRETALAKSTNAKSTNRFIAEKMVCGRQGHDWKSRKHVG